jgi:hypothetical protein
VVALALWVVNRSPAVNWIAWAFAAPAISLTLAALLLGRGDLLAWSSLFESLLYFYSAGALIAYMLKDHDVTGDELFAAGATFTLLAWAFAYAYFVCQAWYPAASPRWLPRIRRAPGPNYCSSASPRCRASASATSCR